MIIKDILDLKNEITNTVNLKINASDSISRTANPGVLQFVGLFASSNSLENCSLVSKALEREFVSFISIITSINSITDEKDIKSYLRRIHQNMGNNPTSNKSLRLESASLGRFKNMLVESEKYANIAISKLSNLDEDDNVIVSYNELSESEKELFDAVCAEACCKKGKNADESYCKEKCNNEACNKEACNKESCNKESCNKESCNKESCNKESYCKESVSKCYRETFLKSTIIDEGTNFKHIFAVRNIENNTLNIVETASFMHDKTPNLSSFKNNILKESYTQLKDYESPFNYSILNEAKKQKVNTTKKDTDVNMNDVISTAGRLGTNIVKMINKENKSNNKLISSTPMVAKDVFKDDDVKKANELMPTMMHLTTFFKNNDGNLQSVDYIIGVKLVAHRIDSDEMIENLVKACKRGRCFIKLIKLTSGEISFFKDFIFAINEIKDDIKSKWTESPWWNALKRRRKAGKFLKVFNFKEQLVPNASIIITMDDVEKCKMEYSIDLTDIKTIKKIMDQLYLLSFVIVDPSVETCYFMFDGRSNFETYSFTALERENSNSKREVQNIMQILGRM